MKIVYAGTGDIGLPALKWLIDCPDVELLAVVCQPDKPVGRKQVNTAPATKTLAETHGIPVRQPQRLRQDTAFFESSKPDLIVVMAYGQLLPKSVLDAPRIACLNLHASILPRHRGASPIQAAIRAGDKESGVTVMHMDEGLDTGDILLAYRLKLTPDETGGSLHDRLAQCAPLALADAIDLLRKGGAPREPQNAAAATHCGKLTREDGRIDWNLPAAVIERSIRAYDPWPGSTTQWLPDADATAGRLVKIFPPSVVTDGGLSARVPPGTVVSSTDSGLFVQTGKGLLQLHEIQLEGKKRMSVNAFLMGNPINKGAHMFS